MWKVKGLRAWAAAIGACAAALAPAASAAPGDRDPAFNGGQPVIIDLPTDPPGGFSSTFLSHVLVDGLDRTVAGGTLQEELRYNSGWLARLQNGGALDPGFGGDGIVDARQFGGSVGIILRGIFRDDAGRLHAGYLSDVGNVAARYDDNGTLDPGYGQDGLSFSTDAWPSQVASGAPDGSAIFAVVDGATGAQVLRVARFDPDGAPDPAYGPGPAGIPLPEGAGSVAAMHVYPDGRALVVGTTTHDGVPAMLAVRLTAAGAPDPTFGDGDGIAVARAAPEGSSARGVAVGHDGSIFLVGSYTSAPAEERLAVVKLTEAGTIAVSFGIVRVGTAGAGAAVAVQGDGKVLVAASDPATAHFMLARLLPDGQLDASFAIDGVVQDAIPGVAYSAPQAVAIAGGGAKLVLGGMTSSGGSGPIKSKGFLLRYEIREPTDFQPPENLSRPGLTGVPKPGATLTCTPGQWANAPTVDVVWERAPRLTTSDEDPAWAPIAGTTGTTYVVQEADLGSRVRCREVAVNGDGSATAPSPSKRVDADVPTVVRRPTLSGTPVAGQRLTCDPGEWTNGPDLSVRWLRDGAPIPGATDRAYLLREEDRRKDIRCEVRAANDVGPAAGPEYSDAVRAVGAPPAILERPKATLETTGPQPTDARLTCSTGVWDEDYGEYEYRWQREGAEIAGAVGPTYAATVEDLGRLITCEVFSTNPAGRSQPARSDGVLVPLPSGENTPGGRIFRAGGFNPLDPINLVAFSESYLDAIDELALARFQTALERNRARCDSVTMPNVDAVFRRPVDERVLTPQEECGVYAHLNDQVVVTVGGVYWRPRDCQDPYRVLRLGRGQACPRIRVDAVPIDPRRAPELSLDEQARLAGAQPVVTLWDFDQDGRADASCDPTAPILRSLYSRGIYNARAVVVSADSATTGQFAVIDYELSAHPAHEGQRGALRPAQPFACRTSIDPPPEPSLPCVEQGTVGRVRIEGNLCPVSMRRIPPRELEGLPADVRAVLERQALDGDLRSAPVQRGGFTLPAAHGTLRYTTAVQLSALVTLPDTEPAIAIMGPWRKLLHDLKFFKPAAAPLALDQIYIANGAAKVNGVDVDPRNGASLVLVPSDAEGAIETVKQMTLSSTDVRTSLGGLPIGDPGRLATDLADRVGVTPPTLRDVNLDALAQNLKDKLDLGPFKLAGETKLRLADDGTAFLDAHAELPGLLSGPGGSPIRTDITVRADRTGKVQLQGVHLEVGRAYLAGVKIKDLRLDYDGSGLSVQGQMLFPPVDAGIAINRFRLNDRGHFQELDVDYLAGAGQGIPVGTGVFMTKLGGGLSMNPDEVRGRATFSVGPSTGGGCPTAGIEAGFVVHFAPAPFYVSATGDVVLVCIPIARAAFYADSTGLVDLSARVNLELGPLYVDTGFRGTLKLPRWQVDLKGEGGIRHVYSGGVKGLIGNLGMAGCGRVELLFGITLAAGAGVRFSNGRPPLSVSELVNNFRVFTGCDLTGWSPFGRDVRAAADGTARTFSLPRPAPRVVALELTGAGGPPRVRLRAPDGRVLDATGFGEDLTTGADLSGLVDPTHSRTVLFIRGQQGNWTVEPAEGSPAIVDLRHATALPAPRITAKVGGAGAARQLRYSVARVPGQQVRFVEHSRLGQRAITTVRGGGRGTVGFTTSEGRGTARRVVAEVVQDGLPRANLTVARFKAPSPRPSRPRRVRVRRRGNKAVVRWARSAYAARYEAVVQTGDGERRLLSPAGKARSVSFGGLVRGEGARVRVVAISPAGHRSRPGSARLRGSLRHVSIKPKRRGRG